MMSEQLNILVVDDDERVLEVFKDFFDKRELYSILMARDGVEALETCQQTRVDFCFTDLNMPGMDGTEFIGRIHAQDNTIPVVVMTGYPSADSAISTLRNGVVDFLVKPFKINEIELTMRRALEKRALFVENMFLKKEIQSKRQLESVNQKLSEKIENLNTLNLILHKVDWAPTSAGLFNLIVKLSSDITRGDESHFFILDESLGRPVLIASFYRDGKRSHEDDRKCIEKVLTKRMSDGIPFLMKDASDRSLSNAGIGSLAAVPLKIRQKLIGMLTAVVRKGGTSFTEQDLYYLSFTARRAAFVIENVALYENIYENLFATLYAFVETIEARDPYTKQHSSRVAELALSVGKEMRATHEELDVLNFSGHLHDIGKIGIRDGILLKPSRLTAEEYEIIKQHPMIGASIIGHLGLMSEEQKVIRHHHERWDGKGYPDGLKGEAVPYLARILAVADVYDAMASHRAYRARIPDEIIIKTIRQNAGSQFAEEVVHAFLKVYERGEISHREDLLTSHTAKYIARPGFKGVSGFDSNTDQAHV
jgi:response regulator RpfG family c-di-GMP phosphodiesterase